MRKHNSWHSGAIALVIVLLAVTGSRAQTTLDALPSSQPKLSPQATPTPSLEKEFFKNILRDQRAIITAPFHLRERDARFLAPLGAATVALIATDRRTASALNDNPTRLRVSRDITHLGEFYTTGGIAGAFYLVGRATKSERARETGLLGLEALIDSGIDVQAIKAITQRPRPRVDDASGEFFDRGDSFPSGHSISAWSLATIVADEYHDHRFVQVTAYGLAAAVSVSRYTGRNHFLSDALVGSALGYGIGHYVYKTHHNSSHVSPDKDASQSGRRKLFPMLAPQYNGREHVYGMTLAWSL